MVREKDNIRNQRYNGYNIMQQRFRYVQDCSKITDDVDDTKHETAARDHGKVGSVIITGDRTTRVLALLVKSRFDRAVVRIDFFTLCGIVGNGRIEVGVNLIRTVNLDVHDEDENDKNHEDDS